MNSKSPYLDAIQHIPGKTAKEKHESLNIIIKETIKNKESAGDFESQTIFGSTIPKVLEPLINTEVAKILKCPEDVISALKSDDAIVINRALQASWIFDGSNKSVTNFNYFASQVLPEISLSTRRSVIKRLSQHLGHKKQYTIAQEFFEGLSQLYNVNQAIPLLSACSENYLSEIIKNKNIILPKKLVTRLFSKYPDLVIRYFKFGAPAPSKERVVKRANISDYDDILPKLIKKHLNDFIDIVKSHEYYLGIQLGKKSTEFFLENGGIDALIKEPKKFLPLFQLKLVSKKLSKDQFKLMFRNLFPEKYEHFMFLDMLRYLEFQPENIKLPLILNCFKDLYGLDLLSLMNYVTTEMLLMLPTEERVKIARKKMETDPNGVYPKEEDWICYLETSESIPKIKIEISSTKRAEDRVPLIGQLVYTCKVNKSEDDLLKVLQYVNTKHRNEISYFWLRFYDNLMKYFSLELLSSNHWTVINEMIQRSYVKNYLSERPDTSERLLEKCVHYNLLNSISIEDRMVILTELKIRSWNSKFNILTDKPNYEKLCFEKFLDIIPKKFPEEHEIWEDNELDTIQHLTQNLYDYNERVKKTAAKKQKKVPEKELMSILNFPWLLNKVKTLLQKGSDRWQYKVDGIKEILVEHEPELYASWFPKIETLSKVDTHQALNLLKKEPKKVLDHWKEYLESCKKNLHSVYAKKFLKKSIWYADIPVKFLEETLQEFDQGDMYAIEILALLVRGSEYAEIIKSIVPNSERMDIDGDDARGNYLQASSVPSAMNEMNPPPPLELVAKFCQGDYLSLGLAALINVSRRIPVNRAIIFAKNLVDKPISVKKHGVRLMCILSTSADLYEFLRHIWNTEKHQSIREVVFQKTYQLFCNQPSVDSWNLLKYLIEGLKAEDRESFNLLNDPSKVPNEYIMEYFETSLNKVDILEKEGLRRAQMTEVVASLISSLDQNICAFFPEIYLQLLLQKYTFDLDRDNDILEKGFHYAVYTYLMGADDKLDSRLNYFCDLLKSNLLQKWDQPHPKNFRFYPMKKLFGNIVERLASNERIDMKILKAIQGLFSSVLGPHQDSKSYLLLNFGIQFKEAKLDGKVFGSLIAKQLPELVKIFSAEMFIEIVKNLMKFLDEKENLACSFTQSLVDSSSIYSSIAGAIILFVKHTSFPDDSYKDIVQKLRKVNHPAVISLLNKHFISVSLEDVYDKNN